MAIWLMRTNHIYQALDYVNEYDVRSTMAYERGDLLKWRPFNIVYATDVYDDMEDGSVLVPNFPSISGNITCDEEAKLVIENLIHDHAEFLPLTSNRITDKQYYILFPTTKLDCLDNELSEFVRLRSGYIRGIRKYAFRSDCIGDTPMFRLPATVSLASEPFVNDEFKQLIEDNNLTGLEFRKVWED